MKRRMHLGSSESVVRRHRRSKHPIICRLALGQAVVMALLALPALAQDLSPDARNHRWGDSVDTVRSREEGPLERGDNDFLAYPFSSYGLDGRLYFTFDALKGLRKVSYSFHIGGLKAGRGEKTRERDVETANNAVRRCDGVRESLVEQHGSPTSLKHDFGEQYLLGGGVDIPGDRRAQKLRKEGRELFNDVSKSFGEQHVSELLVSYAGLRITPPFWNVNLAEWEYHWALDRTSILVKLESMAAGKQTDDYETGDRLILYCWVEYSPSESVRTELKLPAE